MVNRNELSIVVRVKDRFSKGLQRAQTRFQSFANSISGIGGVIAGVVGVSLLDFARKSGQAARDAEAAGNKFSTVFRGVEEDINAWARQYSMDFGIAESATQRLAGTLGDFLVPIGATREQAFAMTKAVSEVAGAIALFDNTAPEQVFEDILSAFAGSSEVLLKYGTVVTETALKQEALRLGFEKTTGALDPYTRSLLITHTLIQSQEDALSKLTITQRNSQAQINAFNAALRQKNESFGEGITLIQRYGAQLGTFLIRQLDNTTSAIDRAGHAFGGFLARLLGPEHGFTKFRNRMLEISKLTKDQQENTGELSEEAKEQEAQLAAMRAEIDKLIQEQVAVFNSTINQAKATREATKAQKEATETIDDSARSWERLGDVQNRATESTRSFAKQQRDLREQEEEAQRTIPERIARELQMIQERRAALYSNRSLNPAQRRRELDELTKSEEYVNRLIETRGITQQQIADALQRENRPQIAKDIEAIESRIGDIKDRQRELEERADKAKIDNLKEQLRITRQIYDVERRSVGRSGIGSPGRVAFGTPSGGSRLLRDIRSERQQI